MPDHDEVAVPDPDEVAVPDPMDDERSRRALHAIVIYGANEMAANAATLGEKVFWRLMRDNAVAEFTRLGGEADMTNEHAPVLVLDHAPHIRFDARDIELMRAAVAAHDAVQGGVSVPVVITGPVGACDGSGFLANRQRCDGCRACS